MALGAGGHGLEGCLPGAVVLHGCLEGLVTKGDPHPFPGMAPAPDRNRPSPLKDHAGSENSRKGDFRGKGGGKREEEAGKEALGLLGDNHQF